MGNLGKSGVREHLLARRAVGHAIRRWRQRRCRDGKRGAFDIALDRFLDGSIKHRKLEVHRRAAAVIELLLGGACRAFPLQGLVQVVQDSLALVREILIPLMGQADEQRLAGARKGNVEQASRLGKLLLSNVVGKREHQILIGRRFHDAAFGIVGALDEGMQAVDGLSHWTQHRRIERNVGLSRNVLGNEALGFAR